MAWARGRTLGDAAENERTLNREGFNTTLLSCVWGQGGVRRARCLAVLPTPHPTRYPTRKKKKRKKKKEKSKKVKRKEKEKMGRKKGRKKEKRPQRDTSRDGTKKFFKK